MSSHNTFRSLSSDLQRYHILPYLTASEQLCLLSVNKQLYNHVYPTLKHHTALQSLSTAVARSYIPTAHRSPLDKPFRATLSHLHTFWLLFHSNQYRCCSIAEFICYYILLRFTVLSLVLTDPCRIQDSFLPYTFVLGTVLNLTLMLLPLFIVSFYHTYCTFYSVLLPAARTAYTLDEMRSCRYSIEYHTQATVLHHMLYAWKLQGVLKGLNSGKVDKPLCEFFIRSFRVGLTATVWHVQLSLYQLLALEGLNAHVLLYAMLLASQELFAMSIYTCCEMLLTT